MFDGSNLERLAADSGEPSRQKRGYLRRFNMVYCLGRYGCQDFSAYRKRFVAIRRQRQPVGLAHVDHSEKVGLTFFFSVYQVHKSREKEEQKIADGIQLMIFHERPVAFLQEIVGKNRKGIRVFMKMGPLHI